jgi:hypothetical protein
MSDIILGRTVTELLGREIPKWDYAQLAAWASDTIVYMLAEGASDGDIVRRIRKTAVDCADENAIHRLTPAFIEELIAGWVKMFAEEGRTIPGRTKESTEWLCDADEFMQKEIEPREPLLVDAETGATVLYQKSLNQVFAYRGIGKSVVANALIRVLTQGGDFLRFRSDGGYRTLLVDGELPAIQLQERLKEFAGDSAGRLKIISPELMANPKRFPVLSDPAQQMEFLDQIEDFKPDVLIFDTLTRIFKFDTNDPDAWIVVNDFLLDLRFRGYCVILIHHAGKNGHSAAERTATTTWTYRSSSMPVMDGNRGTASSLSGVTRRFGTAGICLSLRRSTSLRPGLGSLSRTFGQPK